MIGISDDERRRAFSIWLRSGRLSSPRSADGIELKFNPWHDPETGRFTFVDTGRQWGRQVLRRWWRKGWLRRCDRGTWTSGEFTGGGGGSFGGAGASGTWGPSEPRRLPASSRGSGIVIGFADRSGATGTASPRSASAQSERFRTVVRNGYTYQIDTRERTRHVPGILTIADTPSRSRTSQRQAGGAERRASDDGGHYVAARFNGPT